MADESEATGDGHVEVHGDARGDRDAGARSDSRATTRADAVRRERLTRALLVLLSLAVQAPLFDRGLVAMDEGHLAATADWLLDGKRLYADLHTGIFPGIYLLGAGLFAAFGRDLLVTRIAAVLVGTATALALHAAARRVAGPRLALAAPGLYLALVGFAFPVLSMFNYSTLALAFGLAALVALLRLFETARRADAVALGAALAACALTKQNFGGLVFLALGASLALGWRESALAARRPLSLLVPIALAGAVPTLAVLIWLAASGSLLPGLDATLLSLGGSQLSHFGNPLPPLFGPHPNDLRFVFLYTPPPLFDAIVHAERFAGLTVTPGLRALAVRLSYGVPIALLAASLAVWLRLRRDPPGRARTATRTVIVFASLFSLGIFPSAIWSHLAFVLPPITLLAVLLAARVDGALASGGARRRWLRTSLRTLAVAACAVLVAASTAATLQVVRRHPWPLELERASLRVSERERDLYRGAVAFVDDCAAPGEPILALPDIPVVWFLTARPNPSPYDLAIPGNVDGQRIAASIREANVRCLVMNPRMYPEFPPFKRLFPALARTIEREFVGERVIRGGGSEWLGLVRRDADARAEAAAPSTEIPAR